MGAGGRGSEAQAVDEGPAVKRIWEVPLWLVLCPCWPTASEFIYGPGDDEEDGVEVSVR